MMQSPKAGVFNKLKKKLAKGRRYEFGNTSDDCDSTNVKFNKIEAMYGKIPTQDGQLSVSSRDSSPNVRDSPKRSVLDSPQRANLSEKDTNKTNTYTKDPTKDQKKTGSPTKEAKCNKVSGPIIFINNTYDLPPILPIKKGAISDKRQRSKERSKDHGCNKDSKKVESDKQALGNDHSDENKENSKVIPSACKSPFKSKKEKVNSGKSEVGSKVGSSCNSNVEDGENSANIRGNSGDGKIKEKSHLSKENDVKGPTNAVTTNGYNKVNNVELELVKSQQTKYDLSDDIFVSDDSDENYLIVKMPQIDSFNRSFTPSNLSKQPSNTKDTVGLGKSAGSPFDKLKSTSNQQVINKSAECKKENGKSESSTKPFNSDGLGNQEYLTHPPQLPAKRNIKQQKSADCKDKVKEISNAYEKCPLNYDPGAVSILKEVSSRLAEKGENNTFRPIVNEDKSRNDISSQPVVVTSDKAVHNTYSLTGLGSAGTAVKNHNVPLLIKLPYKQKESTDTCNSLHAGELGDDGGKEKKSCSNTTINDSSYENRMKNNDRKIKSDEYISIEDYGVVVKNGKVVAQNSTDSDDMDIGYTSLADVEKIFGNKEKMLLKKEGQSSSIKNSKIDSVNDDNGNVMKEPGHVIKCDVNIQGCDVRPLLMKPHYIGNKANKNVSHQSEPLVNSKDKRPVPPPMMRKILPLPMEENEYGSIGDCYSSNKNDSGLDNRAKNKHYGARPKQRMPRISDDYVQCDSPIVTKVTVVRDMPPKDDSDTDGYTDLSEKTPRTRGCSSSSNLDVNLNIEVERGISHESGYETGGSGLRSHSSSSNEFIQNDLSNYSLMSEQGDDVLVGPNKINLNDSTSSEEATEMRRGPVYRETIENLENSAAVANLYAFIPKGVQRSYEAATSDGDNGGDSELSGSTDKTETLELSSVIHSPDSITLDTLIDDDDSDAYADEVDYGFEDCDEEDDDYLPPIPTRNYTPDEKKVADGKLRNGENFNKDDTPPLMRVIMNNHDKISTSSKSSSLQQSLNNITEKKQSPERTIEKEIKVIEPKEDPIKESIKVEAVVEHVKPPLKLSISPPTKYKSKEPQVKPKVIKTPEINEGLLAKAKAKTVASIIKSKFSSSVGPTDSAKGSRSPSKATKRSPSRDSADIVKSPYKSTRNSSGSHSSASARTNKYSPVRRKSYEKVERSTPVREIESLAEKDPKSPEHVSKSKKKEPEKRKASGSKESLSRKEKVASLFFPDKKEVALKLENVAASISSNASIKSSTETVDVKPEKKVPDTPSKLSDRSDELYNQSFSSDSTLSLDQQFWASFDEPVHMSMEEVLTQAKDLGIPLTLTMRTSRTSSGSVSSGESVCSPSKRINSQTLPCPKHGIITQDKLPRKKPGTLKDKFASLFAKKTSPKHGDRGSDNIQKRSLPTPPPSRDFDVVDGTIISPSRRHRGHGHYPKSVCQVHGGHAQTISPSRRGHGYCFEDNCCCTTTSSHVNCSNKCSCHGNNNKQCSCHSNSASCSSNCSHGYCVHDSSSFSHSSSSTTHHSSKNKNCHDHHCSCHGNRHDYNDNHRQTRSNIHHNSVDHHRTRHHSTGRVSHDIVRSHHRDRSHSRDPISRSISPHVHSLASSLHSPSRHGYSANTEPRQTRSSSSSGLVDRCPPSPAPSTGTSSVLSAPSAFALPPPTPGSTSSAMAASITMLRDCSPTRSTVSSSNGNVNTNGNADFIGSLSKLKDVGWYWGPLNWDDAEAKLSTKPDGAFMVRDSSDDRYILSLSFRSQGTTHHTRIEHYKGMFSFYSQPKSHGAATIIEFIEKAMDHSRSGKFLYFLRPRAPGLPPAPVQLLYPISRFQNMQTLQHLCRFAILKHVRKDHIDQLPVPQRIKDYLEMSQYYIEYLGDDTGSR